jgi:hypothetical protein
VPCWEYHSKRLVDKKDLHGCEGCLVYKVKATRCYLLSREAGHNRTFCETGCAECGYYKKYFEEKEA